MKKRDDINRRDFLKVSFTSVAALTIVPRHVLGGAGFIPPSDIPTKAIIGIGGMGRGHIRYGGAKLLAICDVDKTHIKRAQEITGNNVDVYSDYREVLQRSDIDIVHIVTPPHWHGIMAVEASNAGKDIWCEKPMTRTIGEGIKVVEAVKQNGTIFRLNTWFRFTDRYYGFGTTVKPIKKLVDSRILGWPLKATINASTGFDWKFYWSGKTHLKPQDIPDHLDYDRWLGPATYKPYHPHRVHANFRGYWDYDGGGLGDMGQHYIDPVQYLLGKDNTSPELVEIDAPLQHPDAVSSWRRIEYTYKDGCKIVLDGENKDKDAAFLEGPDGKLFKGFNSDIPDLLKKVNTMHDPQPQVTDFIQAVKSRTKFALNEENGHRSCTIVNMGKIALRLGRSLKFDPDRQIFPDDPAANRLINQPMRAPWTI